MGDDIVHGVDFIAVGVIFKKREFGHPKHFPLRLVGEVMVVAKLQAELAQNRFGFHRGVGDNKEGIAFFRFGVLTELVLHFFTEEFHNWGFVALFLTKDVGQTFGSGFLGDLG